MSAYEQFRQKQARVSGVTKPALPLLLSRSVIRRLVGQLPARAAK